MLDSQGRTVSGGTHGEGSWDMGIDRFVGHSPFGANDLNALDNFDWTKRTRLSPQLTW